MFVNREVNEQVNQTTENILIVDDDTNLRRLLTSLFNVHGYQVCSVSTGLEALDVIDESMPDVIILGVDQTDMSGWKTYQYLSNRVDSPVLVLTESEPGDNNLKAQQAGMIDIMEKPFHSQELLRRVQVLLQNVRGQDRSVNQRIARRVLSARPTVSVIVPTLNEAKNLPLILPYLPMDYVDEVILVDGRSTDGTVETARRIMPSIKVVLEKKPGKGAALMAGYKASSGDVIIVMDADGSNDPREIPRFLDALMQGADFVKGSRFSPGGGTSDMPRIRRMGNAVFVHMVNLLFNSTFTDLCYGYHAFWAYCLCTMDLNGVDGFEIDTALYLRALREKLKITEVSSFEGYRFYGEGKLRTIPDGIRVLRTIFKEFVNGLLHPCQDLPLGFRGEVVRDRDAIVISDREGNSEIQ